MKNSSRRSAIKNIMLGTVAAGGISSPAISNIIAEKNDSVSTLQLKGNINHSVCRWCYDSIPFEQFCKEIKEIGIKAIDLVGPKDWETMKKYGLYSSMCNGAEINLIDGFNDTTFHSKLIANFRIKTFEVSLSLSD